MNYTTITGLPGHNLEGELEVIERPVRHTYLGDAVQTIFFTVLYPALLLVGAASLLCSGVAYALQTHKINKLSAKSLKLASMSDADVEALVKKRQTKLSERLAAQQAAYTEIVNDMMVGRDGDSDTLKISDNLDLENRQDQFSECLVEQLKLQAMQSPLCDGALMRSLCSLKHALTDMSRTMDELEAYEAADMAGLKDILEARYDMGRTCAKITQAVEWHFTCLMATVLIPFVGPIKGAHSDTSVKSTLTAENLLVKYNDSKSKYGWLKAYKEVRTRE